jgi:hypothetical protein
MGIAHAFPYPHVIPHSDGSCPVDEWMDLGVVGAVILVVQRDKVLALEAAGYSDLDTKRPMRTDGRERYNRVPVL